MDTRFTSEDREGIREAIYLYCRGVDRCDRDALSRAYWPDAIDDHGNFVGPVGEFIEVVMSGVTAMKTHHMIGNVLVEFVSPNRAVAESYFQATHRLDAGTPQARDWQLIGRYLDRFEKRGAEWRIIHRLVVIDGERSEPATRVETKYPFRDNAYGRHYPEDPLYAKLRLV